MLKLTAQCNFDHDGMFCLSLYLFVCSHNNIYIVTFKCFMSTWWRLWYCQLYFWHDCTITISLMFFVFLVSKWLDQQTFHYISGIMSWLYRHKLFIDFLSFWFRSSAFLFVLTWLYIHIIIYWLLYHFGFDHQLLTVFCHDCTVTKLLMIFLTFWFRSSNTLL